MGGPRPRQTPTRRSRPVERSSSRQQWPGSQFGAWDGSHVRTTRVVARHVCEEAGLADPRAALGLAEVHNPDGGLKCFGHPVGASGPRMAYGVYTPLLGRGGGRQPGTIGFGLTHNLGGAPFNSVAAVSILGRLN